MHIVIDARIINSSTGRYVERLLSYLQGVDHENSYTVLVPSKDLDFWKPTSPNFAVMAADFANYSFAEQFGMKRLLDSLQPDLVHFCMPQQPIFYRGRTVTTFHDLTLLRTYNSDKNWLIFHLKQLVGRFVFWRVAHTSDHIVVPTEFTKKDLIDFSGIAPGKVTVTYEAADTFIDKVEPYASPYKHFLLYVGQQPDYKNIRRLGDAHQKLLEKYPDLGLILAGRLAKDAQANKAYFESKNYRNIHFTGFVSDEQRDWLFQNAEAYVFPSLMEGFGLPPLEAMGYGAPVVASRASCIPEVLGDAALYFDPENVNDMAHVIEKVLLDGTLRSRLIDRGHAQVAKYSWQRMAEQTHQVYLDTLSR